MIRKLKSGKYRLYSRKKDPKTGKRRNLGTFATRAAAERHERRSSSSNEAADFDCDEKVLVEHDHAPA